MFSHQVANIDAVAHEKVETGLAEVKELAPPPEAAVEGVLLLPPHLPALQSPPSPPVHPVEPVDIVIPDHLPLKGERVEPERSGEEGDAGEPQ